MSYKIPLFKLNYDETEEKAVLETLRSKWISIGPKTELLEQKFSDMLNINYGIALSSCTAALHLALRGLNIKEGDEVIVPSLTFVATVNSVKYVNATPVFADINSLYDLTISPKEIAKKINDRTKAIIVMHYGGFPSQMEEILSIAKEKKIKLIEDASHAPLSELNNKKLGSWGDIGCFSFFSNKNISTGEGGMIVTNNEEYYNKIKLLRSHGMTTSSYQRSAGHVTEYDVTQLGYNYRIDDIRASLALAQLDKLHEDLVKRQQLRNYYIDKFQKMDEIIIPFRNNSNFVTNYIFPIVLRNSNSDKRNKIRNKLKECGIQTSIHYPAVHKFEIYKSSLANLELSSYVADNEITLPMYAGLTTDEIDYIYDSLKDIVEN